MSNLQNCLIFRIFNDFLDFWVIYGVSGGREVFKKLPGGGPLLCDRVSGRGEPWRPDSCPKQWFGMRFIEG